MLSTLQSCNLPLAFEFYPQKCETGGGDKNVETIIMEFLGKYYWKLTDNGVASGYPRRISSTWKELPSNIDAAFTYRNGKTYFFKVTVRLTERDIQN